MSEDSTELRPLSEIEFKCPFCQARNKANLISRVYLNDGSSAKTRILDGSLLELTCWHCNESAPFEYSVQAVDTDRKYSLWLDPAGDPLALGKNVWNGIDSAYDLRRVTDSNTLNELAQIWASGLDDAAMLLLKHMLAARVLQDTGKAPLVCAYAGRIQENDADLMEYVIYSSEEADPEAITTPFSAYETLVEAATTARQNLFSKGQWVDWDDETARNLWTAVQGQSI